MAYPIHIPISERGSAGAPSPNVAQPERIASGLGGAILALGGLRRGGLGGILLMVTGGLLVQRGLSGRCQLYKKLGVSTNHEDDGRGTASGQALRLEESVHVRRPAHELYATWRHLANLPSIMPHVRSVEEQGAGRSHWVVEGPGGRDVEWDAEIINDKPGELIAWQSLPGADVRSAGTVRFEPEGDGTRIVVKLEYTPQGGRAGARLAGLFAANPAQELAESLASFKERTETAQPFPAGAGA